ncbi:MAG: PIN domain-containing protein [Lachnospiraceae bacterium]|nr:PIN domain-containing protein [Lachnospiraceae bacterium]
MIRIYLDNCCYNRPYDDRTNIKNYLEREAVLIIMQMAHEGLFCIVGSDILQKEMSKISDEIKRNNVRELYTFLKPDIIKADDTIIMRAENIMKMSSIKAFDSLHLACAEAYADILLTTDIKFLKAANNLKTGIKVKNPIDFLLEVNENDDAVSKN